MQQGRRAHPMFRWYPDQEHEVYADVYKAFKTNLVDALVTNPEGVTLPLNLGWLKVIGIKGTGVDYATMRKIWPDRKDWLDRKLRYSGNNCDGRSFTVRWYSQTIGKFEDNSHRSFFNSEIYSFKPSSPINKAFRKMILEGKWENWHYESTFKAPRIKEGRGRPKKVKPEPADTTPEI